MANLWRISGALGIDPNPTDPNTQEVLTQGLGFPLRPIDNVPSPNSPPLDGFVAEGLLMQYMPQWQEGLIYPKGAVVDNSEWVMVANKPTPAWGTVEGYLAFDGVEQPAAANAYGLDLLVDQGTFSEDWEIMVYTGD